MRSRDLNSPLLLPFQAFDCVASGAVEVAAYLLNQMLACCDHGMLQRLQRAYASFAIIGRCQVSLILKLPPGLHSCPLVSIERHVSGVAIDLLLGR